MKYTVTVVEKLVKKFPIIADNMNEALEYLDKIENAYKEEEIVLTADDFESVEFGVIEYDGEDDMEGRDVY